MFWEEVAQMMNDLFSQLSPDVWFNRTAIQEQIVSLHKIMIHTNDGGRVEVIVIQVNFGWLVGCDWASWMVG